VKAGDVKCPMDGSGFVDVDPEFRLFDESDLLSSSMEVVNGRCARGHSLTWGMSSPEESTVLAIHGEMAPVRQPWPVLRLP
jgi:hypothetical protein